MPEWEEDEERAGEGGRGPGSKPYGRESAPLEGSRGGPLLGWGGDEGESPRSGVGASNDIGSFAAYVTGFELSAPVEGVLSASVTLMITGAVTWA